MQTLKLEIKNATLELNNNLILDGVDLIIPNNEITSIIGSSASGKSSLLRLIAGFEKTTSGYIKVSDRIVDNENTLIQPQDRNIGIIFQDLALFPHLNCEENIVFGIFNQSDDQKKQRLNRLLDLLNISKISKKYPHELSGGQQQRIAVARALAPKPEILLLDEPFSALDELLKEQLIGDVKKLLKEEKITTIVITHNIKEAFQLSDRIAFLGDKKIIQHDTPYNLYHKPLTREIANFCGLGSFIKGNVIGANHVSTGLGKLFGDVSGYKKSATVDVMIRPDDIIHDDNSTQSAQIVEKVYYGSEFLYKLKIKNNENIFCFTPSHHNHEINEVIGIKAEIDHLVLFEEKL